MVAAVNLSELFITAKLEPYILLTSVAVIVNGAFVTESEPLT